MRQQGYRILTIIELWAYAGVNPKTYNDTRCRI